MKKSVARILAAVNPFMALGGTVFLAAALLATITLTTFDRQWIVFLGGVLAAAILAFVSHNTNARFVIARRTAQLSVARGKLVAEGRLRLRAEESLSRVSSAVELVDEALPAMLAYVDKDKRVQYHNRAYARWTGKPRKTIEGMRVEEIVGPAVYAEVGPRLDNALAGRDVRYERTQPTAGGDPSRLSVQYLPHFEKSGKVAGVFAILTDITRAADIPAVQAARPQQALAVPEAQAAGGAGERLISALEHNEFSLHCQPIVSLGKSTPEASFCEVLLRMQEEEDLQLPPGTFLPVAEELGLLHVVDRWVVRHVVDHAATARARRDAVYFVNLSAPTIRDAGFAQFVRDCLKTHRVPDHTLCFELPEAELLADPEAYRQFTGALEGTGCRFAVSGSAGAAESIRLLQELRVDFLKLDGGIIFSMLRTPAGLARVKAINQSAHDAGMRTVAECVESETTRVALARIGVDFAQGFGIGMPRPIRALDEELAAAEAARALEKAAA